MSGFNDGVSKIWVMRTKHGLDIDGFKTPVDAIAQLVRSEMGRDSTPEHKALIRDRVEEALRHMDEPPSGGDPYKYEDGDSDDGDEDESPTPTSKDNG